MNIRSKKKIIRSWFVCWDNFLSIPIILLWTKNMRCWSVICWPEIWPKYASKTSALKFGMIFYGRWMKPWILSWPRQKQPFFLMNHLKKKRKTLSKKIPNPSWTKILERQWIRASFRLLLIKVGCCRSFEPFNFGMAKSISFLSKVLMSASDLS